MLKYINHKSYKLHKFHKTPNLGIHLCHNNPGHLHTHKKTPGNQTGEIQALGIKKIPITTSSNEKPPIPICIGTTINATFPTTPVNTTIEQSTS